MSAPSISLFVTTYEMPKHLRLVLAALERQSFQDFELLLCDDGSGPETRTIIQEFIAKHRLSVKHIWQEHEGFRKCRILNQAVREARGQVFVFLDGDCVPHRHFLRDHWELREEGCFLAGRRVELGPKLSEWITVDRIRRGFFDRPRVSLLLSALQGDTEHFNRSVRYPWPWLRSALGMDHVVDMKGCNYSVTRKDLEAINGFDEAYEGYGREDTDVELRLRNLGLRIKSLKGVALQFHVWHPRREFTPANDSRLEELKRSGRTWCEMGIVRRATE